MTVKDVDPMTNIIAIVFNITGLSIILMDKGTTATLAGCAIGGMGGLATIVCLRDLQKESSK